MKKQPTMLERMLQATEKTGDIMLRYQYQKDMIKSGILSEFELDRIADKVISRIAITTDIIQAIEDIKELQNIINNLGK